jgi:hypothetical protein
METLACSEAMTWMELIDRKLSSVFVLIFIYLVGSFFLRVFKIFNPDD